MVMLESVSLGAIWTPSLDLNYNIIKVCLNKIRYFLFSKETYFDFYTINSNEVSSLPNKAFTYLGKPLCCCYLCLEVVILLIKIINSALDMKGNNQVLVGHFLLKLWRNLIPKPSIRHTH